MTDIFVSCEHEERDRLMYKLCVAMQPRGWSIWCDTGKGEGKPWADAWARLVDMELAAAKCVLVVWTARSVESSQVHHCARQGQNRGCLFQVVLDGVSPPPDFRDLPSVDLSLWDQTFVDSRLNGLRDGVRRIVGGNGTEHQKRAREHARQGAHAKLLLALAGSDSAEARDHQHRGFLHSLRKDLARAIADCSMAIEIDPRFAKAYETRAISYYESQLYERAIDDLSKLIEFEPGYFGGHSLRGLARVQVKDYGRAIADFDRAIALETEHCGTYYGRGLACHGAKAYDAAISSYTKAIEKASEYGVVPDRYYRGRAQAYEERGLGEDRARAEIDYVRALCWAHPTDVAAEEGLARLRGDAPAAR